MSTRSAFGGTAITVVLVLLGCDQSSAASSPGDTVVSNAPMVVPSTPVPSVAPASAPVTDASKPGRLAPLELLRLTLTSGVQAKEPVDKLDAVAPGQRVYAHLAVRNRSGEARKVHVSFLVNDKLRTPLDLDVEPSWSYRTWGYNTLQAGDTTGELQVRVTDDTGATLGEVKLPIRAK